MNSAAPITPARIYQEDLMPVWQIALQKLLEIAIQIIVPLGITLAAFALGAGPILLTFTAICTTFATAFLFARRTPELAEEMPDVQPFTLKLSTPSKAVVADSIVSTPAMIDITLRGVRNISRNCWINSLAQLAQVDVPMRDWVRRSPTLIEGFFSALFLDPKLLFTPEELALVPSKGIARASEAPKGADQMELLKWCWKIPEFIRLEPMLDEASITDEFLAEFPEEERLQRGENARACIRSLSAEIEKMSLADRDLFKEKLTDVQALYYLLGNLMEDPAFELDGELSDEDRPIWQHWSKLFRTIRALEPNERVRLLRYLRILQTFEYNTREAYLILLNEWNQFYVKQREGQGDSQNLRLAFSLLTDLISRDPGKSDDPTVAFPILCDLLPPEMKVETVHNRTWNGLGVRSTQSPRNEMGYISLAFPKEGGDVASDIESMLAHHFDPPAGDQKLRVDKVEHTLEKEELRYVEAPPALWLHLKRFNREENNKISSAVAVPDIAHVPLSDGSVANFELDGFIVHFGNSRKDGHYIAYIRVNSTWYEMNDAKVSPISSDALAKAKSNAYFIHYSPT
jgi:hypothetical protein